MPVLTAHASHASIATPEFWALANAWASSTIDTPARAAALVEFIETAMREHSAGSDLVDIARTICLEAWRLAKMGEADRAHYPSALSLLSPLFIAARRACIERGFGEGDLVAAWPAEEFAGYAQRAGLDLSPANDLEGELGDFPCTYWVSTTEAAWRAWANKPSAPPPQPS